jgi:two-component system, LytTR family, response regulator
MIPAIQPGSLLIPTCKGIEIIATADIVRIEAISNYSKIYLLNGKTLVVSKVLKWFEETLDHELFLRVHRTHIVNKLFIHRYVKTDGYKVGLINGDLVDVSRRKKMLVIQSLYRLAA